MNNTKLAKNVAKRLVNESLTYGLPMMADEILSIGMDAVDPFLMRVTYTTESGETHTYWIGTEIYLSDLREAMAEDLSDCCDAPIHEDIDICSDCKDHC